MPTLRHAYPYSSARDQLEAHGQGQIALHEQLEREIDVCKRRLSTSEDSLFQRIQQNARTFVSTQSLIQKRQIVPEEIDLRKEIARVAENYPQFNTSHEPVHEPQLLPILEGEGLQKPIPIPDFTLLSACASHIDPETGQEHYRFYIKDGLYPALRDFLIAHELGHWWLHLQRGKLQPATESFYLHSAHEWGRLEDQADIFALITIFPTPYVSWCELEGGGTLDPSIILQEFCKSLHSPRLQLQERMLTYINKRIAIYNRYKKFLTLDLQRLRLPDGPIPPDALAGVLALLNFNKYCWAQLDKNYVVTNCSDSWAQLYELDAATIKKRKLNVVTDLTPTELQIRVRQQLNWKKENLRSTLYFPHYQHPESRQPFPVMINAYATIGSDGKYSGSIGIVTPYPATVGALESPNLEAEKQIKASGDSLEMETDYEPERSWITDSDARKNLAAYLQQRSELARKYPREYVAFVDEKLAGHDSNRKSLIDRVYRELGTLNMLIERPDLEREVIDFSRPECTETD